MNSGDTRWLLQIALPSCKYSFDYIHRYVQFMSSLFNETIVKTDNEINLMTLMLTLLAETPMYWLVNFNAGGWSLNAIS